MSKKLKKIFLVEDEEDIRTIAQMALEDIGDFTVGYGCTGQEALEKIPDFHPDLILLDVMMPGMDGIETYQELRKRPELSDTPVIFMTARVQASEVAEYKDLGALDVIYKPFDPLMLANNIKGLWTKYHENRNSK